MNSRSLESAFWVEKHRGKYFVVFGDNETFVFMLPSMTKYQAKKDAKRLNNRSN